MVGIMVSQCIASGTPNLIAWHPHLGDTSESAHQEEAQPKQGGQRHHGLDTSFLGSDSYKYIFQKSLLYGSLWLSGECPDEELDRKFCKFLGPVIPLRTTQPTKKKLVSEQHDKDSPFSFNHCMRTFNTQLPDRADP